MTTEQYIEKFAETAKEEMKRSGVPASITIAQGIHESDCGNSRLARIGNNHFGIKCHKWKGEKMYKDDDHPNECFRRYNSASESFIDHSNFILGGQRYNFLFEYKTTDYKRWAKGLKKAGYATNPRYAEVLIKIIEDYKLYELDKGGDYVRPKSIKQNVNTKESEFVIRADQHAVHKRNDIEYVIVKHKDTYKKLCDELEMFEWEFYMYNEITKDSVLREGQILYLQPKCRTAERGTEYHTVLEGETLHSISQLYGIKIKHLRRMNRLEENDTIRVGEILNLRSKRDKNFVY